MIDGNKDDDYIYCPEMKDIILKSQALCLVCGKCDELPTLKKNDRRFIQS